jgi:hypothetical protein
MNPRKYRLRTSAVLASVLSTVLLLGAPNGARAAFQSPQLGARSAAMSGASIPAEADTTSIFQNAAGVAGLKSGEAYMMYDQLYAGQSGIGSIGQSFITAGAPTRWGALSIGLSDFNASGLLNERVIGVGFSRRLSPSVAAGVTGKYLYHKYAVGADQSGANDPVFAHGASRGAASLDAGVIATLSDVLSAGLSVRNINSPDVGLASTDRVPREYQAGLAFERKDWGLKTTADLVYRDDRVGTLRDRATPSIGLEKSLADGRMMIRAGADMDQFTAGIGLRFDPFEMDYAFIMARTLISSSGGSHMLGLRYRFGGNK